MLEIRYKIDIISDIKGTLTNFKTHVGTEREYFDQNAVQLFMQLDGLTEEEARAKYEALVPFSDKKHPDYKKVFVAEVNRVAEVGYRNGSLSLENSVKEGVGEFFEKVHQDDGRIILVGLAHPEATRASLATVGLDKYADAVYASADVGSKTDGTAYKTIAEREGLNLARCMYLDDKLEQAEGAVKAGIGKAGYVLDGKEKPEKKPADLPPITDSEDRDQVMQWLNVVLQHEKTEIPAVEEFSEIDAIYKKWKFRWWQEDHLPPTIVIKPEQIVYFY